MIPEFRVTMLIGWMALHAILMTSSSFIEEEHQIVYFLATTMTLVLIYHRMSRHITDSFSKKLESMCSNGVVYSAMDEVDISSNGVLNLNVSCIIDIIRS